MLMQAINELNLTLRLVTVSPLIVSESRVAAGKPMRLPISRASATEVDDTVAKVISNPAAALAAMNDWGDKFYIPGSSMRGAWRAHLERVLRSMEELRDARVCDPLADKGDYEGCGHALLKKADPYRKSCPICQLFGSTVQGSRLAIGDGERAKLQSGAFSGEVVARDHIRIDRRLGCVAVEEVENRGRIERRGAAPLKFFGLQNASFVVRLRLRNFELDHLLIAKTLLDEIQGEQISLGSGKSKGYGRVKGVLLRADLTRFGMSQPDNWLRGISESRNWREPERAKYGFEDYKPLPELPAGEWKRESGWRFTRSFVNSAESKELDQFLAATEQLRTQWEARWKARVQPLTARAEAS
jgi:CRISPR/Cas system CSM-associated protein Csm3 (group 7 of RAMP superfamily)